MHSIDLFVSSVTCKISETEFYLACRAILCVKSCLYSGDGPHPRAGDEGDEHSGQAEGHLRRAAEVQGPKGRPIRPQDPQRENDAAQGKRHTAAGDENERRR